LVVAPWAVAQQPQAIYVYLDLCHVETTIAPLVGDLATHAAEVAKLKGMLKKRLPAWEFVAGATPAYPRLTIALKHVGSVNRLERAQVDADIKLEVNEIEPSIPLCNALTLYKPVELEADLARVDGGTLLRKIADRFDDAFGKLPREQYWPVISRVPIGYSFVSFHPPKTVLLPWPWETFGYWSLSKFKTQCPTADGVTILISEARGLKRLHTRTGIYYVAAEHTKVKPPGGPEGPADKHLGALPCFKAGSIFVTELNANSVYTASGNAEILR